MGRNPQVEFFGKKYFVPPQRSATVAVDVDGDGIPDYLVSGADRDGDGIPDALQGGPRFNRNHRQLDPHLFPERRATVAVDVDGDGIPDILVSGADRDGDGIPDALQGGRRYDNDAYHDRRIDALRRANNQRSARVAVDVDGDGIPDYIVSGADRDGDGIPDALQGGPRFDRNPYRAHPQR